MNKKNLIIVGILVTLPLYCFGADPKPLFVLIEYDPWAMVIGSDNPTFALYVDGTVIFKKEDKQGEHSYYSAKLASPDSLISRITLKRLASFKERYTISEWTDQPTNVFYFEEKRISVYGDLRRPPLLDPGLGSNHKEIYSKEADQWRELPNELHEIFKTATTFDNPNAKRWLPEYIELMFWPYDYAPEASIFWPNAWPDLKDSKTVKRENNSYSVYLPSDNYTELMGFLKTQKQKGAIEINGKKMAVSFRFPFPNENRWMK